jgi:hypothetical protein
MHTHLEAHSPSLNDPRQGKREGVGDTIEGRNNERLERGRRKNGIRQKRFYAKLRRRALFNVGGPSPHCRACGSLDPRRLELHHRVYAKDSPKGGGRSKERAKEAIIHPERFEVWCGRCHENLFQNRWIGNPKAWENIKLRWKREKFAKQWTQGKIERRRTGRYDMLGCEIWENVEFKDVDSFVENLLAMDGQKIGNNSIRQAVDSGLTTRRELVERFF